MELLLEAEELAAELAVSEVAEHGDVVDNAAHDGGWPWEHRSCSHAPSKVDQLKARYCRYHSLHIA